MAAGEGECPLTGLQHEMVLMDQGNPFRNSIDSLLIDLEWYFLLMINKVIKPNKENTPQLKGTLTIELNQVNTCFTFQQVLSL